MFLLWMGQFSTKWMEEFEKFGGYPTTDGFNDLTYLKQEGKVPFKQTEENPYVDAFLEMVKMIYIKIYILLELLVVNL